MCEVHFSIQDNEQPIYGDLVSTPTNIIEQLKFIEYKSFFYNTSNDLNAISNTIEKFIDHVCEFVFWVGLE